MYQVVEMVNVLVGLDQVFKKKKGRKYLIFVKFENICRVEVLFRVGRFIFIFLLLLEFLKVKSNFLLRYCFGKSKRE